MTTPTPDDGSRPDPRIPYVHGRHVVPIRRQTTRYRNHRHDALFAEEDDIRSRIAQVDRRLVELAAERRQLLQRIARVHDQLRPSFVGARGRRRRAVSHDEPLPPTADKPTWLSGRALRAVCLAFLGLAPGPLSLRQLHAVLHRAGYAIAHAHPVKALADALGHETDHGRLRRVQRGHYEIATAHPPNHADHPDTLPDW